LNVIGAVVGMKVTTCAMYVCLTITGLIAAADAVPIITRQRIHTRIPYFI
jgi:hypothetical protein